MSDIFISYRRQDSDAYAGRLYDRLAARFDKARIFMDIDLGIDFANEIEQRVGSCKVLVAVIGRSWLEVKNGEGRRRLDDPNDWVRLELKRLETLAGRPMPSDVRYDSFVVCICRTSPWATKENMSKLRVVV